MSSLFEMILNEQTILLGVGAALAPLTIALLLWGMTSMRKASARRKVQRAAERVRREEARALAVAQLAAQQAEQPNQPVPAAVAHAADPEKPKSAEGKEKSKITFESAEAKPEEDQENNEDGVSAAMQDLLSSVFDDDSNNSPYAALLENLSTVDTSDLIHFAGQISSLLNTQTPAAADEEH